VVASIEIAAGWLDAVQRYVDGLAQHSIAAAQGATDLLHQKVTEKAKANEGWSSMADNITMWSQDGQLFIGVTDPMFVSQASLLEYGDLDTPPNPLFRTLSSEVADAGDYMRKSMETHYGPLELATPKVKGMRYGR
jgi:hypothetical protein